MLCVGIMNKNKYTNFLFMRTCGFFITQYKTCGGMITTGHQYIKVST
jgi:hypothetical protein